MNRITELRRFASREAKGIEIAPYFNPAVPKAEGFDVLIVDVFDTDRLHLNARQDPNVPDERIPEIEPVDIVGDASQLGEVIAARGLAGKIDYIVSSHNFEHLPDPIRFLQGCTVALREGGTITMAIPDYRACFDHFRMPTRLADWLSAYHRRQTQPSPETLFDYKANNGYYLSDGKRHPGWTLHADDPANFRQDLKLREAYAQYRARLKDAGAYEDAHCSMVFGELFELLLRDLAFLGLVDLDIVAVTETRGHEFFVHLRKTAPGAAAPADEADYQTLRMQLQRTIAANLGSSAYVNDPRRVKGVMAWIRRTLPVKAALKSVAGAETSRKLSDWNRARRARRKDRATPPAGNGKRDS